MGTLMGTAEENRPKQKNVAENWFYFQELEKGTNVGSDRKCDNNTNCAL